VYLSDVSLTPCKRFAFAVSCSGRETLLRKASETTAQVAGFGFHSKDCGPSGILGFVFGLAAPGRDSAPARGS